ncbi:MAG: T9SS type A sorting domain-containing protein, partial [Flavobacteriales bacterium]|nr:T9SS type A sorting domain-containing protein [Flavobacteriales bacterium]
NVSAVPVGNGNVPDGYATLYLLAADGVIIGMEEAPTFVVDAPGTYGIHALVHDPATLDPAVIAPGLTTLAEVDAMLEQGGGAICGSLGMTGAPVLVIDCAAQCAADAGTLTAADDEVFLAGGSASFFAFANGDMLVPPGHQVLYLLSAEGTVTATAPTPVFTVNGAGTYTIHTLVHDPATFNPATIEPGTTTIAGLHAQFIPGGGALCGDLDGTGATVEVVDCTDDCTAYAGTLSPVAPEVCHVAAGTVVAATHNGDAIKPVCFERIYFLSMGAQQVLINASVTADFVVDATGLYTIHTLVFDPHTLDPNSVTFGLTTTAQLEALLVQGGGTICASLDMAGAVVQVVDCLAPGQATGFKVWPSPAHRTIHAEAAGDAPAWISIWTMQGTCVLAPTPMHTDGSTAIDISGLRPGQYIVRMTSDDQVRTERFVKAE